MKKPFCGMKTQGFVCKSPAMKPVNEFLLKHAGTNAPVIIEGESGTGKEFAARLVHYSGPRRKGVFSTLSITSLPPECVFEELFDDRTGRLHNTRGGSLLLKELWALPKKDQEKLAGILEDDRKGRHTPLRVYDVRLMTTSTMDLEQSVECNFVAPELKKALQYNRILIPPLRRRPSDIRVLAELFMAQMFRDLGRSAPRLDSPVVDRFTEYHWPGNVKELKDVMRRIVVKVSGKRVQEHHLKGILPMVEDDFSIDKFSIEELVRAKLLSFLNRIRGYRVEGLYSEIMSRVERPLLELVLEETGGNQLHAAKLLGINRNTLRDKIKKKNIIIR